MLINTSVNHRLTSGKHSCKVVKITYASGTAPQRNRLYTRTHNSICNPDTHLHLDKDWTHTRPALHTDIYTLVEFVVSYILPVKMCKRYHTLGWKTHGTYFTVLAFEALCAVTQVGARLALTCSCRVTTGIHWVVREMKDHLLVLHTCACVNYQEFAQFLPIWQRFPLKPSLHTHW